MKIPSVRQFIPKHCDQIPKAIVSASLGLACAKVVVNCTQMAINCTKEANSICLHVFGEKSKDLAVNGLFSIRFAIDHCSAEYSQVLSNVVCAAGAAFLAYNLARQVQQSCKIPVPPKLPGK